MLMLVGPGGGGGEGGEGEVDRVNSVTKLPYEESGIQIPMRTGSWYICLPQHWVKPDAAVGGSH